MTVAKKKTVAKKQETLPEFRRVESSSPKRDVHYEGWIVLRTPLQHGGNESFGTTRLFRSQKMICADGELRKIPVYSGNAVRGMFRDIAAGQLMAALGRKFPPHVFDFLTSGGSLTLKGNSIDLGLARRLRDAAPMVGLFGGGVGNQIMEGKINFIQGTPICRETLHVLPDYCHEAPSANLSIRDLRQFEFGTRRDDKKKESQQSLLEDDWESEVKDSDVATQMIYETETLAMGTCLRFGFTGTQLTTREWLAMASAVVGFMRRPYLGARASAGYGEVSVPGLYAAKRKVITGEADSDRADLLCASAMEIDRESPFSAVADQVESEYLADVAANQDRILNVLAEIP